MITSLLDTTHVSVGRQTCISFRDIEKAHRVLGNVMHCNAPYYQLAAGPIGELSFYPLLLFAQALIYQGGSRSEIDRYTRRIITALKLPLHGAAKVHRCALDALSTFSRRCRSML